MTTESKLWRWALVASIALIGVGVLKLASPVAYALQNSFAPEPARVATVDLGRLLEGLEEKKQRESELASFARELKTEVDQLKQDADDAKADLEAASADTRDKLGRGAITREVRYRAQVQVTNALIEQRIARIQLEFFEMLIDEVQAYAQSNGYDIVLTDDRSLELPPNISGPELENGILSRRVAYVRESNDITDEIATYLNNKYRASGGGN